MGTRLAMDRGAGVQASEGGHGDVRSELAEDHGNRATVRPCGPLPYSGNICTTSIGWRSRNGV